MAPKEWDAEQLAIGRALTQQQAVTLLVSPMPITGHEHLGAVRGTGRLRL